MGLPGPIKILTFFYNQIPPLKKKKNSEFFIFQRLTHATKLLQDPKNRQINSKVIFYMLNNDLSFTPLSLAFVSWK